MNNPSTRLGPVRPGLANAFGIGAVVGVLGGLIGLGGAEFRLPILIGLFGLAVHRAVQLNLLVSLATVAAAALARFGFARFPDLAELAFEIAAVAFGAVLAAWIGAGLLARLDTRRLTLLIAALLAILAVIMLAEAALGLERGTGLPEGWSRLAAGVVAGLGIGLVSSLLGVAGGELLIPTFMLVFGADVTTAGTASLLVSLPTVAVGVARFSRQGAYAERADFSRIAAPMALGSLVGAFAGAALLPYAPGAVLKGALGLILAVSALKLARKH